MLSLEICVKGLRSMTANGSLDFRRTRSRGLEDHPNNSVHSQDQTIVVRTR